MAGLRKLCKLLISGPDEVLTRHNSEIGVPKWLTSASIAVDGQKLGARGPSKAHMVLRARPGKKSAAYVTNWFEITSIVREDFLNGVRGRPKKDPNETPANCHLPFQRANMWKGARPGRCSVPKYPVLTSIWVREIR